MAQKILFIIPPNRQNINQEITSKKFLSHIPYGVLSLIAYAKKVARENTEFKVLDFTTQDFFRESMDEMLYILGDAVADFSPDMVGFSIIFNSMAENGILFAQKVKSVVPDCFTVSGGAGATSLYQKILECEQMDCVSYGEGELAISGLINAKNPYAYMAKNDSLITRQKLTTAFQPRNIVIENLDEIPPVDFSLINLNAYHSKRETILAEVNKDEVMLPMYSGRGCPYNCIFCTVAQVHGKRIRYFSKERVVSEIKELKQKYGANVINFGDDQVLMNRDRIKSILMEIINLHLDVEVYFSSGVTINFIDEELAALMKQAGVRSIKLALESGSEYVLKNIIHKPIQLGNVPDVISILRKYEIEVYAFLVVGFPGEKEEHRQETIDFVKKHGLDWVSIFCAGPYQGSRLYDICMEKGYTTQEKVDNLDQYSYSIISTEDFSSEYITRRAYLMNLELNFLNNYHLVTGNYRKAMEKMNHVIEKYPFHAIAYYIRALAAKGLEDDQKYKDDMDIYFEKINHSEEWKEYALYFKLPVDR